MKKYGLIGYPLSHSFSKQFFTEKFHREGLNDHEYDLYPLQNLSELPALIKTNPDLCGINVTVPHKIGVMYYLNKTDAAAREIGAVNCIKIVNQPPVEAFFCGEISSIKVKLEGYNTDAYAFEASLKPLLSKGHRKALILGNGGASRAVAYALNKLEIPSVIVSRRAIGKQLSYKDLNRDILNDRTIIINSTPLGTYPEVENCPDIPYEFLGPQHLLYDLVYNPEETEFLRRGRIRGATTKNGLEMLHLQAEKSWEIWNS